MSMSDRELLELAAKAAGVDVMGFVECHSGIMVERADGGWWDPLEDDGDALRIAIQLNMTICTHGMGVYAGDVEISLASAPECTDEDRPRIVRRCIVRAAAQIGKSMQESK